MLHKHSGPRSVSDYCPVEFASWWGHHTINRLEERGVERGSARRSFLKGRGRAVVNQTNIGIVSKAVLGKLLRWGRVRMGFSEHIYTILNWTEKQQQVWICSLDHASVCHLRWRFSTDTQTISALWLRRTSKPGLLNGLYFSIAKQLQPVSTLVSTCPFQIQQDTFQTDELHPPANECPSSGLKWTKARGHKGW